MTFVEFCERELRLELTRGQRVLARVAFEGVAPSALDAEDREIARALFGDVDDVPPIALRTLALRLGRMSGKSTLSAAFALFVMVTADVASAGPGDVPTSLTVAPTKKLAGISVRMGLELARRSPRLAKRIERETTEGFALRRRDGRLVAFEAVAASRGGAAGRGVTILVAILDEAEFMLSDEGGAYAVNDRDVFAALAPRARRMVLISTPWPVPTLMGELVAKNWANPTAALVAKGDTLTMRDHAEDVAEAVEAELARDPDNARREFFAEGDVGRGGAFFDGIDACIDPEMRLPLPKPETGSIRAGADLALSADASSLVIVGAEQRRASVLDVQEIRPERGAPLRMSSVIKDFATRLREYRTGLFMADGWSRESAREFAAEHGVEIAAAPEGRSGKTQSYLLAKQLIAEGRVRLPAHPRLLTQLRSVASKPAPGGGLILTSPRRAGLGHGDVVSAFVLALWLARHELEASDDDMTILRGALRVR